MTGLIYGYQDLGYGVILSETKTVFLQGEAADQFLNEVETLKAIWENGSPNPSVFPEFQDHLNTLIDRYF